jgi:hypothetical protein
MKIPTTPLARRIAALVKRRPTTPWSDKEIRQYGKLFKAGCFNALADLELLEQFYAFQHKRGDDGVHRRDLLTLLNHFPGEIDKATGWRERHPLKQPPRKIIPLPLIQSYQPVVTAEPEVHERFLAEYAERKAAKGKA